MSKNYTNAPPEGWKTYEQFVVDMTTYRLPPTTALAASEFTVAFDGSAMHLRFEESRLAWSLVTGRARTTTKRSTSRPTSISCRG